MVDLNMTIALVNGRAFYDILKKFWGIFAYKYWRPIFVGVFFSLSHMHVVWYYLFILSNFGTHTLCYNFLVGTLYMYPLFTQKNTYKGMTNAHGFQWKTHWTPMICIKGDPRIPTLHIWRWIFNWSRIFNQL